MNKYTEMLEQVKNDKEFNRVLEKTIKDKLAADKNKEDDDAKRMKKLIGELECIKNAWVDAFIDFNEVRAEYDILLEQMYSIKNKLKGLL